jgi:hypothetical protein
MEPIEFPTTLLRKTLLFFPALELREPAQLCSMEANVRAR